MRDDLALMVSGERVRADIGQYAAVSMEINSRDQIYSAMVVYGLLSYSDGEVLIPNKELMDKFNELLLFAGNTKAVEEIYRANIGSWYQL